jgi:predicted Fe-Mo cluster-binding NifX family protein
MRIAIPATGKRKLTNKVADTFSRASTFTVITLEDLEIQNIEKIENPASPLEQGAEPIAARAHLHTYTPKNPLPH